MKEGPFSWYPRGHENEHVALMSICDVTQLFGDALTSRLTVRAGHFCRETKTEDSVSSTVQGIAVFTPRQTWQNCQFKLTISLFNSVSRTKPRCLIILTM